MKMEIRDNNSNAKFVVSEELNLKKDEAIVCLGMADGTIKSDKPASKPMWKSIRFSTKGLKATIFDEELVEILSAMLIQSAKHHGWTDWD